MQIRPPILLLVAVGLFFASGCAVVTNGLHQKVAIASAPAGATVVIDGQDAGRTPMTANLTRAHGHQVELRKAGFAPVVQSLSPQATDYSRRFIRFGVDIDSGAASELTPASIAVELVPAMLAVPTGGDAFEQMSAAVLAADDLKRTSAISDADHRFIIEKILAHFGR